MITQNYGPFRAGIGIFVACGHGSFDLGQGIAWFSTKQSKDPDIGNCRGLGHGWFDRRKGGSQWR
jgi:hypothetical protein